MKSKSPFHKKRKARLFLIFALCLFNLTIYSCTGAPYEFSCDPTLNHPNNSGEYDELLLNSSGINTSHQISVPVSYSPNNTKKNHGRSKPIPFDSFRESLNMIKDWSAGLVTVNSGLIALTGALLKDITETRTLKQAKFVFGFFLLSIVFSTNVIGSLPGLLLSVTPDAIFFTPYSLPGNLGIPLIVSCNLQIISFIAGLGAFFVVFSSHRKETDQNDNVNYQAAGTSEQNVLTSFKASTQ